MSADIEKIQKSAAAHYVTVTVIVLCAKKEFFEKGYTDASIRTIAKNAGVSTSTIYTRYSDKEGLFRF